MNKYQIVENGVVFLMRRGHKHVPHEYSIILGQASLIHADRPRVPLEHDRDLLHLGWVRKDEGARFIYNLVKGEYRAIMKLRPRHLFTPHSWGYMQKALLASFAERLLRSNPKLGYLNSTVMDIFVENQLNVKVRDCFEPDGTRSHTEIIPP